MRQKSRSRIIFEGPIHSRWSRFMGEAQLSVVQPVQGGSKAPALSQHGLTPPQERLCVYMGLAPASLWRWKCSNKRAAVRERQSYAQFSLQKPFESDLQPLRLTSYRFVLGSVGSGLGPGSLGLPTTPIFATDSDSALAHHWWMAPRW